MFNAKVYKIAVLSFSGMIEEVYAAKEAVSSWNKVKADTAGKLFMLVDDSEVADVLLGIVGNRIEKQELVEECLKAGKHVLLFFNAYADPKNTIASEQSAVSEYMQQVQSSCFCVKFNGTAILTELLKQQLNTIE